MSLVSRLSFGLKILRELGPVRVGNYALYRLQLSSGYLRRRTLDDQRFIEYQDTCFCINPLLKLPDRDYLLAVLGEAGSRGSP